MSTPEPPEYLETLSPDQRDRMIAFLSRVDATTGYTFNSGTDLSDLEHLGGALFDADLIARGLRAAQLLGYEGYSFQRFFEQEFGIGGVTEGNLGDWLSLLSLADVEKRIFCAAGGRN
jgi:hypothetical protein